MKLVRNRADAGGAILLVLIVLASVALWSTGYEVGRITLLGLAGVSAGMAFSYFATRPLRTRKLVAVLFVLGSLALYVFLPFGIGGFASPYKALFFGLFLGVTQGVARRLFGSGVRAGD